jgi:ubiquitin thioesterase OTU1
MECQTPNPDGLVMLRRVIDSDNSCLFNSIGFCMFGEKTLQQKLRTIVKEEIESNPGHYEPMLEKPIDEYCEWIMRSTSWGGGIELYILSKYFHVEMCVINIESLNDTVYGEDGGYDKRIYLLYSGIHYDAISRNIFEEAPEESDEKLFDPVDNYAYEGALFVASELRKKKQFTNLKEFDLICGVCYKGCKGQKEAVEHCKETGHANFQESADFAK